MDELVFLRWLGEQIDEDERTARATTWDGSDNKLSWELIASATIDVGGDEFYVGDRTIANHMMAHDPERVLREIDAKRQLVALHKEIEDPQEMQDYCATCEPEGNYPYYPCKTLRLLALSYADRPGYREEWRP
ncbi:DUF6221 family protein [Streptomyces sp. NPDC051636]|uniref:DUF6221 family protein n=1 Tax=Streptomyces sp. NPDC051636 TaxID=3365663 RepID=UPI0037A0DCAE